MNRRGFLISLSAIPATTMFGEELPRGGQQITHVDSNTKGERLHSSVVTRDGLHAEGAAPGAKAYVSFNGPTAELGALISGAVTLEPGAEPHPPHRHPEEEIMIVGEGRGEFFVNGVAKQVKTGDMIFAEANVLHGVKNTGSTQMIFYFIKIMG